MKRIVGPISSSRGDTQPDCLIGLEVCATRVLDGELGDKGEQILDSWSAVASWTSRGDTTREAHTFGADAGSWWAFLGTRCRPGKTVWVCCPDLARALTLLDFWKRIESGAILVTIQDARPDDDPDQEAAREACGYVVLDDPPTIVRGRIAGRPGAFCLVDARNYHLEDVLPGATAEPVARRMHALLWTLRNRCRAWGLGSLKPTLGSLAWQSWRRTKGAQEVMIHDNTDALRLEREAIAAGRVECSRIGRVAGPIYYLDLQSAYTWIAATEPVPVCLVEYLPKGMGREYLSLGADLATVATVTIHTDEPCYPARRNEEWCWPVGEFVTTLAGPELSHALAHDRVGRIHCAAVYRLGRPLREYASALLLWRDFCAVRYDALGAQLAKSLGNALVGRLAARGRTWVLDPEEVAPADYATWWKVGGPNGLTRYRSWAGVVQREENEPEGPQSFPAITAWIWSRCRVLLWELMRTAGLQNVLYVCTDGLFVNQEGRDRLDAAGQIAEGAHGKLRQKSRWQDVLLLGVNHYWADGVLTCAGLPKGAHEMADEAYRVWARLALPDLAQRGKTPRLFERLCESDRPTPYRRGRVRSDGTVEPWRLPEDM